MKVFGITLDEKIARSDRPYVFVKLETNQGVVGWGEATLEGKARGRDGVRERSARFHRGQRSDAIRALCTN